MTSLLQRVMGGSTGGKGDTGELWNHLSASRFRYLAWSDLCAIIWDDWKPISSRCNCTLWPRVYVVGHGVSFIAFCSPDFHGRIKVRVPEEMGESYSGAHIHTHRHSHSQTCTHAHYWGPALVNYVQLVLTHTTTPPHSLSHSLSLSLSLS